VTATPGRRLGLTDSGARAHTDGKARIRQEVTMTPLMLYWAACFVLCAVVIAGTVFRQVWLRRQESRAMMAKITPMDRSDDAQGPRGWARLLTHAPANGERRRGPDRREGGRDRRAPAQPHA